MIPLPGKLTLAGNWKSPILIGDTSSFMVDFSIHMLVCRGCSFRDGYPCCLLHLAQHRGWSFINFCEAFDSTTTRSVLMGYQFTIGWWSFWVDSCVPRTEKNIFWGWDVCLVFFFGGGLKNDPRFLGGFWLKDAIRRIVSLTRTSCFRTESKRKPSEQLAKPCLCSLFRGFYYPVRILRNHKDPY